MTSIEKYYWYKEHEKEIEVFFIECFKKWFEEYINKLPNIKDVVESSYGKNTFGAGVIASSAQAGHQSK